MCKKYLDAKNLENILKTSNKLEQKKEKIKIEILKLENNNNKLNKKIDACYNDKLYREQHRSVLRLLLPTRNLYRIRNRLP